ncbi:hypothetical protein [Rhizobium leguminosarum]|uniref:hypothetical protein n=1 Tax=Rhizobium leguminosarum TaxID=384 RepID=UPI0013DB11C9|nr:hypothetical protein [Rhizobium leguminosarum]NEH97000.1 hypothetical protein [Rhizobium leguminosarum]
MEIYSRATGGDTLHITQGNGPPLEGWGINGLTVILTTLEHRNVDAVLQLYSHIDKTLLGDYDVRADLTAADVKNLRFHVCGRVYYYWNRVDYYDGKELTNQCREHPDEEDADFDLEGLTAIEAERKVMDTMDVVFQRTQRRMCEFGLGSMFQTIVDIWNQAVATSDFRAFIEELGRMLPAVLRAIAATHPTVYADDDLSVISDENLLLKLAIQGRRTDEEVGWNAGEAFAYLIGDLNDLHRFELVDNLVTSSCQVVDGYETDDECEPILFWDFLFELDNFLTGLLDCVVQFGRAIRKSTTA